MGMFDREPNLANEEWTKGPFELLSGEYQGIVKSADYGENRKARVVVRMPDGTNDMKTFTVYGVLADQIGRMDDSDLPTMVKIAQEGRANVFVRAEDEPA